MSPCQASVDSDDKPLSPFPDEGRRSKQRSYRAMVPDSVSRPQLPGTAIAEQQQKQNNYGAKPKRSLDYIIKSGLAGGLAGCAVSPTSSLKIQK